MQNDWCDWYHAKCRGVHMRYCRIRFGIPKIRTQENGTLFASRWVIQKLSNKINVTIYPRLYATITNEMFARDFTSKFTIDEYRMIFESEIIMVLSKSFYFKDIVCIKGYCYVMKMVVIIKTFGKMIHCSFIFNFKLNGYRLDDIHQKILGRTSTQN